SSPRTRPDRGRQAARFGARRGGRVVECTALEMRHRCKPIGGSNPSLSATRHGTVEPGYGSPSGAKLVASVRGYDFALAPDSFVMSVPRVADRYALVRPTDDGDASRA